MPVRQPSHHQQQHLHSATANTLTHTAMVVDCVDSHYAGNLSKGVLCGTRLTCPLHAACFNVETGDIEDGPVVNKLRKYPASVKDGRVYVTTPANLEDMAPKGMQPSLCSHVAGDDRSFVIIGGGPAGLTAAQTLREEG